MQYYIYQGPRGFVIDFALFPNARADEGTCVLSLFPPSLFLFLVLDRSLRGALELVQRVSCARAYGQIKFNKTQSPCTAPGKCYLAFDLEASSRIACSSTTRRAVCNDRKHHAH